MAASGELQCANCHAQRFCSDCHAGERVTRRYHPADFVSTHPPQAYSRETECSSCHSTEAFCRDCHRQTGSRHGAGSRARSSTTRSRSGSSSTDAPRDRTSRGARPATSRRTACSATRTWARESIRTVRSSTPRACPARIRDCVCTVTSRTRSQDDRRVERHQSDPSIVVRYLSRRSLPPARRSAATGGDTPKVPLGRMTAGDSAARGRSAHALMGRPRKRRSTVGTRVQTKGVRRRRWRSIGRRRRWHRSIRAVLRHLHGGAGDATVPAMADSALVGIRRERPLMRCRTH